MALASAFKFRQPHLKRVPGPVSVSDMKPTRIMRLPLTKHATTFFVSRKIMTARNFQFPEYSGYPAYAGPIHGNEKSHSRRPPEIRSG